MILFRSNSEIVAAGLAQMPKEMREALPPTMKRIGAYVHRYLVTNKLSTGTVLLPRTGNTKRAVFNRVEGPDNAPVAVVGIDQTFAPGARINNDGGTILPRNAKKLTVPLEAAKTAKGVLRFTAQQLFRTPAAFGFSGVFIRKGVILARMGGRYSKDGAAITPLFVLKSRVQIVGKHFMEATLAETADYATTELSKMTTDVLLGGAHG